eukprot:COSAG04_NODE_28492_length_275_cov_0.738636_2_plen_43_part_01
MFAAFDKNGDGVLTPEELSFGIVSAARALFCLLIGTEIPLIRT